MATGGIIQMNKSMRCRQKEGTRQEFCALEERWRCGEQDKDKLLTETRRGGCPAFKPTRTRLNSIWLNVFIYCVQRMNSITGLRTYSFMVLCKPALKCCLSTGEWLCSYN
jgi:hypothetical protein